MINRLLRNHESHVIALTIFHFLFLVIFLTNFPWGKWFIGWDSIHPEFDFLLNFNRALFAGWQENYGVGTLTGHGFAALLPHTLITFLLSFIMPSSAIRPAFTLLCLYFGGLGLYFLARALLNLVIKNFHTHLWQTRPAVLDGIALLASFYYLFNLATIQIFYVQLEAFIVHFAALPWLFLSAIYLIKDRSRKHTILFTAANFLATIQGFIPSLFVAYLTGLSLFLFVYVLSHHLSKIAIKSSVLIILLTFFINAYWFLPIAYFTLTHRDTYLNSYNNLISTPEFVQKSQKYGDLADVALLKGFFWDSFELGGQLLSPWIKHQNISLIPIIGYLFFGVAVVGLFASLFLIRDWMVKAFSFVGLYFFASIAVSTPPFSLITSILQWLSPTYNQAFRITFTKFSLGSGFAYSILFSVGLLFLFTVLHKIFKHRLALYGALFTAGISLVLYALPIFRGNLIYKKMLIDVPQSYFEVMDYFKDKGDGRIADFPQDCPEGWYSYRWDYFGSGFLWYGVKQPILARSFDVWSPYNENYYWELIQAIREEDFARVENIFDKYGAKWILYDQNFIYCRDQHGVFTTSDFVEYVESSPNYKLVKNFEAKDTLPIKVYERVNASSSYVSMVSDLHNVGPVFSFNDRDTAYGEYGTYLTNNKTLYGAYYPFGSLFSKRGVRSDVEITTNENELIFTSQIPKDLQGYSLRLLSYSKLEKHIPIYVRLNPISENKYEVFLTYQFLKLSVDGQLLGSPTPTLKLGEVRVSDINNASVYINNSKIEHKDNGVYESTFYFSRDNTVQVISGSHTILFEWHNIQDERSNQLVNQASVATLPTFSKGKFQVVIPKVKGDDVYGVEKFINITDFVPESCGEPTPSDRNRHELGTDEETEYIRMISQNSRQCLTIPVSELYTSMGHVFEVKSRHISGGNLRMFVKNKDRQAGLDVYLSRDKNFTTQYFIMSPTFPNEIGYDFVFQNASFNDKQVVNDVAGVAAWYFPYNFLKSIKLERDGFNAVADQVFPITAQPIQVEHSNNVFYKVNVTSENNGYLLLLQGFDEGWKAYETNNTIVPFLGKELKNHVLINNWANGWELDQSQAGKTIVIVYLPQYLEYFGFLLLFGFGISLVIWRRRATLPPQ